MPLIAIALAKDMTFHGVEEEHVNVYHYNPDSTTDGQLQNIVDTLAGAESAILSDTIGFKESRVWSAGGTAAQNETLGFFTPAADTQGRATLEPKMHKESVYHISFRTGRESVRSRPIYLHKYMHSLSRLTSPEPTVPNEDFVSGAFPIPALGGAREALGTFAQRVERLDTFLDDNTTSVTLSLMAPSGATAQENEWILPDFVTIHELKY